MVIIALSMQLNLIEATDLEVHGIELSSFDSYGSWRFANWGKESVGLLVCLHVRKDTPRSSFHFINTPKTCMMQTTMTR